MNDTAQVTIQINSTFGKRAADAVEGIEAKVKASMRAVIRENWMERDEDALMRAGIGGALLSVGKDSPDYERIVASVEVLRKLAAALNAAQQGISVDFADVLPDENAEQPLPLMAWWREARDEVSREGGAHGR